MAELLGILDKKADQVYRATIPEEVKKLTELWEDFEQRGVLKSTFLCQVVKKVELAQPMSVDDGSKPESKILKRKSDTTESETEAKKVKAISDTDVKKKLETCDTDMTEEKGVSDTDMAEKKGLSDTDMAEKKGLSDTDEHSQGQQMKRKMNEAEDERRVKKMKVDVNNGFVQQNKTAEDDDCQACSPVLPKMTESVKPFARNGLLVASTLSVWIACFSPAFSDENHVTEGSREAIENQLNKLKKLCQDVLDSVTAFNERRAKLVSKLLKYPTVLDYRTALKENDENQMTKLSMFVLNLRHHYAGLHDCIGKNLPTIKKLETDMLALLVQ